MESTDLIESGLIRTLDLRGEQLYVGDWVAQACHVGRSSARLDLVQIQAEKASLTTRYRRPSFRVRVKGLTGGAKWVNDCTDRFIKTHAPKASQGN